MIPMEQTDIFKTDAIGLKYLKENGNLIMVTKPFVHHLSWHTNKKVVKEVVLPYLD